jgi:predicted nucleotidyltransferase
MIETAIAQALDTIAHQRQVHILLAVESGSRAWGFASPDSDYDVRFVYAHERNWYLRIGDPRDVIEAMLPGDLDLSGWDLRKTLRLFAKCNLALNEWLDSPITYRQQPAFVHELRELIPLYFRPTVAMFHYLGIARSAWKDGLSDAQVKLKKVFYVLRPLLACRWIEHTRSQPPTAFATLKNADWVTSSERDFISELEQAKAFAQEGQYSALSDELRQWMQAGMTHTEAIAPQLAVRKESDLAPLDALLLRWVEARRVLPS